MEVCNTILLLNSLMESSSSSSEDEIEALVLGRDFRPKVKGFVRNVVYSYSEAEYKKNFHVSRDLANYLVEKYSSSAWYTVRSYKGGRSQAPAETHILAFLWFAANKTTFREVGNIFGLSLSSTYNTFYKVLNFIVKDVAPTAIRFPNENHEKEVIAKEFENIAGFPNVLGCIDSSFISSRKPRHKIRSAYANRHDCVSITLQGICDANLRFLDVFTGVSSKIHDSQVLKLSYIGKELPNTCAPKYYLLGDSAYPLRDYLLTPFWDYGNLTEAEKLYNIKFSQTRVIIENAFGMLKSRFRQLMRLDFNNIESITKFVIACCVLHNLCIERDDLFEYNTTNDGSENICVERDYGREHFLTQLGQIKRHEIKNHIYCQRNQQIY